MLEADLGADASEYGLFLRDLGRVYAHQEKLLEAEEKVLLLTAQLKQATRQRDHISQNIVPDFLNEVGIEEIKLRGGRKIELTNILSVRPPPANRPLVLEALVAQGAGGLIKTTVSVPFGRGEQEAVKALLAKLQADGMQAKAETKVESSTLKRHVRLRLDKGLAVDKELFGVRDVNIAKFTENAPVEPRFDGEL